MLRTPDYRPKIPGAAGITEEVTVSPHPIWMMALGCPHHHPHEGDAILVENSGLVPRMDTIANNFSFMSFLVSGSISSLGGVQVHTGAELKRMKLGQANGSGRSRLGSECQGWVCHL